MMCRHAIFLPRLILQGKSLVNGQISSTVRFSIFPKASISSFPFGQSFNHSKISRNEPFLSQSNPNLIQMVSLSNDAPNIENKPPLTGAQKLKKLVAEYGSTVIIFHVGISLISLGTSYLLVSSGINLQSTFEMVGLSSWTNSAIATNAGTFAVAYALHKVFAPVRITITLTSVPFIVRYLRAKGILKAN